MVGGNLKKREHVEDLGVDGGVSILKWIFKKREQGRHSLD
jgi:hypothetical protein